MEFQEALQINGILILPLMQVLVRKKLLEFEKQGELLKKLIYKAFHIGL